MSRSPRKAKPVRRLASGSSLTRRGQRVALRPLGEGDSEAMARWRGDALVDSGDIPLAITCGGDASTIGVLAYRLGYPRQGWLSLEVVSVEPRLSGQGYDAEAVRLLEEAVLERAWASRFCAPVRHDDGLGLYFWLRLGYRPAAADESPWPGAALRDMMAMIRVPAT